MKKSDCNITVLFPGGFKPLNGAHINLINRYLEHPSVKKIVLFISPSKRDFIEVDDAHEIIKILLPNPNIEIVLDEKSYSPILAIYRWVEMSVREPGVYVLAASSKNDDYNRVKEFTKNYKIENFGKNLPSGVVVDELLMDVEPLKYEDGEFISSSIVRDCIKTNNYKKFKESYPNVSDHNIQFIWNKLKK